MNVQILQPEGRLRLTCRHCAVRRLAPCAALQGEPGIDVLENAHGPLRHISAGRTIFDQGAPSDRSYTVLNGWIAIYQVAGDGRTVILHFVLPGEVLPFNRHSAVTTRSAVAIDDVTVCTLSRARQERLEHEYPGFDARQRAETGRNLHLAYENIGAIAFGSAKERIAHLLWGLACRSLRRRPLDNDHIAAPLSQIQIGLATGLTPVHVSRTLRCLREARLLGLEDRKLTIHHPAVVERMSGVSVETMALLV